MIKVGANIRIIPQGNYTPEELRKEFSKVGLVFTLTNIAYLDKGEKDETMLYPPDSYYDLFLYTRFKYRHDSYNSGKYEFSDSIVVITFMVKGVKMTMTRLTKQINQTSIKHFKDGVLKARAKWLEHGRWD